VRVVAAVIAVALVSLLAGCGDEPVAGVSSDEFAAQRDALKASLAHGKPATPKPPVVQEDESLDGGYGTVNEEYAYESEGKRDPFRSFQWLDDSSPTLGFGPLGEFELGQLSVLAVVWDAGNPRALVVDPGGRSFVVHEGSQMGRNNGRVIHIGDNLLLVKETYVDFEGTQTTRDVEMRIRRSQGG
jgi:type IV pilus assembly protein PilP